MTRREAGKQVALRVLQQQSESTQGKFISFLNTDLGYNSNKGTQCFPGRNLTCILGNIHRNNFATTTPSKTFKHIPNGRCIYDHLWVSLAPGAKTSSMVKQDFAAEFTPSMTQLSHVQWSQCLETVAWSKQGNFANEETTSCIVWRVYCKNWCYENVSKGEIFIEHIKHHELASGSMSLAAKATWESEPVFRQKANAMVKEGSRKHGQTKRSSTICITTNKNIVHNIDFEKSLSSKDLSFYLGLICQTPRFCSCRLFGQLLAPVRVRFFFKPGRPSKLSVIPAKSKANQMQNTWT